MAGFLEHITRSRHHRQPRTWQVDATAPGWERPTNPLAEGTFCEVCGTRLEGERPCPLECKEAGDGTE